VSGVSDVRDEVRIRRARQDDADVLAAVAARLFRQSYKADVPAAELDAFITSSFSPDLQRAELADPGTATLLLEHSHDLLGYAQLRVRPAPTEAGGEDAGVELARIYLDRAWHGRGAGALLLSEAGRVARDLGADAIWLGVWERNGRAIAFYEKHGFRIVGAQPFRIGEEVHHDLVMVGAVADLAAS
jgi:ribosomal protein S18 acetylase RimI-like enzyme